MRPGTQTAFRDVTLSFAMVMAVVFLLPHLPKRDDAETTAKPPGTITGEIVWPDGMNVDIDLWFRGPDGVSVGYNNPGSPTANLLRDDLGSQWDFMPLNHELIATRGAPPGEYQFNVYYFRGDVSPVPVHFALDMRKPSGESIPVLRKKVEMKFMTQEITLVRFSVDQKGDVVPGSVVEIHRGIARARGEGEKAP